MLYNWSVYTLLFLQHQTMECDQREKLPKQRIQSPQKCPVRVVMESAEWTNEGGICH